MRHFVLKKAQPVYSDPMLQMRIQGTVVLRVIVDKSGVPNVVSIVSGHPALLQATIDAAKKWRYKPYWSMAIRWKLRLKTHFTLSILGSWRATSYFTH